MDMMQAVERLEQTPDVIEEIALRIGAGEPIWNVARFYNLSQSQLLRWLTSDGDRALRYGNALKANSHNMVAEAVGKLAEVDAIAERVEIGQTVKTFEDGTQEIVEADMLGHRRLRVETKIKVAKQLVELAGIVNPATYGPKSQVSFSGTLTLDAVLAAMEAAREAKLVGSGTAAE